MITLLELKRSVWKDRILVDSVSASEMMGCSVRTVYRMAQEYHIKVTRIGNKHFFMVKDFMKVLEEKNGGNPPSPGKN